MGPAPSTTQYIPWQVEVPTYRCPSDPGVGDPAFGRTNYAACMGDSIVAMDTGPVEIVNDAIVDPPDADFVNQADVACRGPFVAHKDVHFRDFLDGLSNTVMCGEINTYLGDNDNRGQASIKNTTASVRANPRTCQPFIDPNRPRFWTTVVGTFSAPNEGRGYRWASAGTTWTEFNTILPPNYELCFGGGPTGGVESPGVAPPSSRHQGGAHLLIADGAVKFITDSIECGDMTAENVWIGREGNDELGTGSPYGLWGSLGTTGGDEIVEEEL